MSLPVYYCGPAKVAWTPPGQTGTVIGLLPNETNGQVTAKAEEKTTERGTALAGRLFETLDDVTGSIDIAPFDNWSLLPYLYPTWLGVTTLGGTNPGALTIGINPFDPTNAGTIYPSAVWTADGRLYDFTRTCIFKHPPMKLGPGEKLFGSMTIGAYGQLVQSAAVGMPGTAGFLMAAAFGDNNTSPISETAPASGAIGAGAAADPSTVGFTTSDFAQSHWTASWGNVAGFQNMEGETGIDLVPEIKYVTYSTQKISRVMKLVSVQWMAKMRIVGPSHSLMLTQTLSHTSGGILTGTNVARGTPQSLLITSSSGKSITLVNCQMKSAPFVFGGTALNTDEIAWVTNVTFSGGLPQPQLIFSS